jgi:hypothetical protein
MLALEILLTSRNQYWKDVTITNVKFVVSTLTLYSLVAEHIENVVAETQYPTFPFSCLKTVLVCYSSKHPVVGGSRNYFVTSSTMSFSTNNLIRFGSGTSNLLRILGNNQIGAGNGVTSRSIQLSSGDQSSLGISFYTSLIKLR